MRNNNEYAYSDGFGSGGSNGAPVIAPTFLSAPTQPYAAPIGGFGGFGGFGEGGLLGGLVVGSLLGGRGFGGFGRDGVGCIPHCGDGGGNITSTILGANILSTLGDISGAIPLASLQTQNAILEQTGALSNQMNQSNLAQLAATAGVKDAVQNGTTAVLLNASQNTQAVLGAICNLSSKIDQNLISQLQTELSESRHAGRARDIEVNVTQNATQVAQQQQNQIQLASLFGVVSNLANDLQTIKQGQIIFNGAGGVMTASGTQAASNTKVA